MRRIALSIAVLVAWCWPSCALAQIANGINAVVDDSVITFFEVEQVTTPAAIVLRRQYASDRAGFNRKYSEALGNNLDKLMERQLILHEFESSGFNLPESIIDQMVQERIKEQFGDRRTLIQTLQEQGQTYEEWRRRLRENFIIEIMRARFIPADTILSPHRIETYYQDHQEEFRLEDQVKLSMIVLNKVDGADEQPRRLAEEILTKVEQGGSFGDLAATYSQGSTRTERGDWGWVERPVLREELAEVAFALKPGEVSGVIEIREACYIMRVEDVKLSHVKPLKEVREEIERTLEAEKLAQLQKEWIDRLKRKTFVRYY